MTFHNSGDIKQDVLLNIADKKFSVKLIKSLMGQHSTVLYEHFERVNRLQELIKISHTMNNWYSNTVSYGDDDTCRLYFNTLRDQRAIKTLSNNGKRIHQSHLNTLKPSLRAIFNTLNDWLIEHNIESWWMSSKNGGNINLVETIRGGRNIMEHQQQDIHSSTRKSLEWILEPYKREVAKGSFSGEEDTKIIMINDFLEGKKLKQVWHIALYVYFEMGIESPKDLIDKIKWYCPTPTKGDK